MASRIQNQWVPDWVSPPGDTLQEILDAQGLSQLDLARRIGRSAKNVNQVIKGKAPILPEFAIQLETVLGVPARFWLVREQHYRESIARSAAEADLAEDTDWPSRFPIKEMIRRGWVRETAGPVEGLRALLRFFAISSPTAFKETCASAGVAYRRSQAFKADQYALVAWLRQGEIEAQQVECRPYDEQAFLAALQKVLRLTAKPKRGFNRRLRDICSPAGVAVVVVEGLPKCRVSGATRWLSSCKAMLQLSVRYKSDDQFWFSFFHEAGHIIRHRKKQVFIEDGSGPNAVQEEEANSFAEDMLIPRANYASFKSSGRFDDESVRKFARTLGIAPGIVVGRLQHDRILDWSEGNHLKVPLELADS